MLFTGTLVAMIAVSPLFALLVTKLPRRRFIPIVYRVSMGCLFAFWLWLKFSPGSLKLTAAYTFFVWFSVFNLFATMLFWAVMADRFSLEQTDDAHAAVEAGAVGKVLINVARSGSP